MTIADLYAQLAAIPDFDELGDFEGVGDMILADLIGLDGLNDTTLVQLGDGLSFITFADLIAAIEGLDEATVRNTLALAGIVTLRDLLLNTPHGDGIVLGDLPQDDPNFQAQTIEFLLDAMGGIRLADIFELDDTDLNTVDWGDLELGDVTDWEDVTLADFVDLLIALAEDGDPSNDVLLAQLIEALLPEAADELTYGDLLLSLLATYTYDWQEIDLAALDLDSVAPVGFSADLSISSQLATSRTVEIQATLPIDGKYLSGSTTLVDGGGAAVPIAEPEQTGTTLAWTADTLAPNVDYTLSFDVSPSLTLGSRPFGIDTSLIGQDVSAGNTTTVTVTEAYEPNDNIGDANIVSAVSDTIYVSHISDDTDIDLYSVDLAAGSRLAVSLSSLPADYDLVVYGPTTDPLVPLSLRQIDPTESPELGTDPTETSSGNVSSDEIVLQDRPVVALSANRDLADDFVDISAVRATGTYFIQVSGYNGANSPDPYALFVDTQGPPVPLTCVAQDYQVGATGTPLPTDAELAGVNTLILTNGERMTAKYGAAETGDVFTALDAMVDYTNNVNPGFGINAAVIPLDGSTAIRAAYGALDAESCQPERANDVVREIASLIADLRGADPATEIGHIMIVGDDDIVPMARIADYTTIANEDTYASTFLGTDANTLFGAASLRYFLSDEPYGDIDPIIFGSGGSDRALYVTDTALGRVLETPAEIVGQLGLFIASQGELDPSSALVSGYDFLTDGAQAVADTFDGFPETTLNPTLINETWTSTDLLDEIYPVGGDSPTIAAINAHYDHYRALPADGNATGSEEDLFTTADITDPVVSGELAGHLYFSMGCHGGLSVPDELFPGDERALDWAQAYAQEQAIWVGNTGYGYGETRTPDGVELSERLMLHFAQRLDGSLTAGEALFFAKQWYLGTQKSAYGEYDEKVLQQATFYGIPFFKLGVLNPPPPEPIPPQPLVYPAPNADIDISTITSDPFFIEQVSPLGDGSSWTAELAADAEGSTGSQATPFTQIQPTISFDVSNVDQITGDPVAIAQGALITTLTTRDELDVDPDLARPVVDDSSNEVEPIVGDVFSDLTVYVSQYREPEGERQQLTATLGSFSSNEDDFSITGVGTQRLFEEIGFEVLYRDLASDSDQEKPTFLQTEAATVDAGASSILVIDTEVTDVDAGNIAGGDVGQVVRVTALVGEDLGTTETAWTPVELTNTGGNVWSGSVGITAAKVEYVLQAVDANGNVALSANKGRYFVEETGVAPPPPPAQLDVGIDREPDAGGFYNDSVTVTVAADGADVDYQIDNDDIVDAGTGATVVLDPAVLGDGVHTVTIFSPALPEDYVVTVVFDTTAPVASITSPIDGATLLQGDDVDALFLCSDAASGVASCTATLNGAPIALGDSITTATGTFTLTVTAVDTLNNNSTASVTFTVDPVVTPTCGALDQEGEDGDLMGDFAVGADPLASGGEYAYVPDDVGNTYSYDPSQYVEYCVTITTPGNHRIDATTIGSNYQDDSFFVQIDNGDIGIWDVKRSSTWTIDPVSSRGIADPLIVDLGAGDHTIRFYLREDATLLDRFELVWLDPGSYGGPAPCLGLAQEAEVGQVAGSVQLIDDGSASGGQAVGSAADSGRFYSPNPDNYAEYCVAVAPEDAGVFRIEATTIAPDYLQDSFFVQIDGSPDLILWDVKQSSIWTDDAVSDRNVADPFTIQLDAGDHSIRFIQREGGTQLDKFELVPVSVVVECGALSRQAEDGTVAGTMQVLPSDDAVGGLYVGVPEGTGNTNSLDQNNYVEYCFNIAQSDTYRIRAWTLAMDNRSDSFFVQMDDDEPFVWNLRRSNRFIRQVVRNGGSGTAEFSLSAGEHRLRFYAREDGAAIDSFTIYRP